MTTRMKRREFLATSVAVPAIAGLGGVRPAAAAGRESYELRAYRLQGDASRALLDGYLERAAIPALNRIGLTPVGAFSEMEPQDGPAVYSPDSVPVDRGVHLGRRPPPGRQGVPESGRGLPRDAQDRAGLRAGRQLADAGVRGDAEAGAAGLLPREEAAAVRVADLRELQRNQGAEESGHVQRRRDRDDARGGPRADLLRPDPRRSRPAAPDVHDLGRERRGAQTALGRVRQAPGVAQAPERSAVRRHGVEEHPAHPAADAGTSQI